MKNIIFWLRCMAMKNKIHARASNKKGLSIALPIPLIAEIQRIAAFGMEATQAAMGHVPLSATTRRHYARAVSKSDAERFFGITNPPALL